MGIRYQPPLDPGTVVTVAGMGWRGGPDPRAMPPVVLTVATSSRNGSLMRLGDQPARGNNLTDARASPRRCPRTTRRPTEANESIRRRPAFPLGGRGRRPLNQNRRSDP
jgi:hypothetical protein